MVLKNGKYVCYSVKLMLKVKRNFFYLTELKNICVDKIANKLLIVK